MKKLLVIGAMSALMATSVSAQNQKLTSKMFYRNGPVLTATRANLRTGLKNFLIQHNWVNDRKVHWTMSR